MTEIDFLKLICGELETDLSNDQRKKLESYNQSKMNMVFDLDEV